jgi:hypothetical protein
MRIITTVVTSWTGRIDVRDVSSGSKRDSLYASGFTHMPITTTEQASISSTNIIKSSADHPHGTPHSPNNT